jgi:hypothetical protein
VIHRGHTTRGKAEKRLDPFHLGMCDCMNYRELRSPWVHPCIEQLRYLLGFVTFALEETESCGVPLQIHWKKLRGNRRHGKYRHEHARQTPAP